MAHITSVNSCKDYYQAPTIPIPSSMTDKAANKEFQPLQDPAIQNHTFQDLFGIRNTLPSKHNNTWLTS